MVKTSNVENLEYIRANVSMQSTVRDYLAEAMAEAPVTELPYVAFEMVPSGLHMFNDWKYHLNQYAEEHNQLNFIYTITLEEWKQRKLANGQKLGKYLKKLGFPKEVLDYDGSLERVDGKRYGLILNPCPWAKAGMSSLARKGSWNGFNGTSCQDIRNHDGEYPKHVLGSIVNDYYTIQMIELKDGDVVTDFNSYEAMVDRLEARVNAWNFDGRLRTQDIFYGSSRTKQIMQDLINQLAEAGLDIQIGEYGCEDSLSLEEFIITIEEAITVCVDDYYTITCPACCGRGTVDEWDKDDNRHTCECPACCGSGEYEIYIEAKGEEEIEREVGVLPYEEGIISYNEVNICNEWKGEVLGDWLVKVSK